MELLKTYLKMNGAQYIGFVFKAKPKRKPKGVFIDYPVKVAFVPIGEAEQFFRRESGQYRPDVSSAFQIERLEKYNPITLCTVNEFELMYAVWKMYHKGNRGHFVEWVFVNVLGAIDTAKTSTGKCTTWIECGDVIYNGMSVQLKAWDASVAFSAIRNLVEKKASF